MRIPLIITLLFWALFIQAQDCEPATAMLEISNENMRVNLLNGGDAFWDLADGKFIVPDDPTNPISSVFAGALWIGGFDPGGNLKVAAQTYRQSGIDFYPGPIDDNGEITNQTCNNFDRIWKVSSYSILNLIADYEDNNTIDDPIGPSLLSWPARGNPFFLAEMGFELPDQDLAPFFDRNNDGNYNPMDGEYPVFDHNDPNAIAWELTWCVFNDVGNLHFQTGGNQLGIEVQQSFWTLQCTDNETLNYTLFNKNKIINKSFEALFSLKVGQWVDFDLGCYNDDHLGSIPELNTFYVYNGSNDDQSCQGVNGYGPNPPVFAVTYLNHDISTFMSYNNNFMPNGNPETALQYYNYISGLWKDATPWEWGGDGYNQGTFPISFFYPDNPNDNNSEVWHEIEQGNTPGDRRGVGSVGPFTLLPGDDVEVAKAYSYHRDESLTNLGNVDLIYNNVPGIQTAYDNGFGASVCMPEAVCTDDCVWPGDANANGIVNYLDFLPIGIGYSESGLPRSATSSSWTPKNATNWQQVHPGELNFKHLDAFGDGNVGEEDVIIVHDNYAFVNDFYAGPYGDSDNGTELYITKSLATSNDTLDLGISFFDIVLKPSSAIADDIHGIGFRLLYPADDIILTPAFGAGFITNDDVIRYGFDFEGEGHFDFAHVKVNNQPLLTGDSIILARVQLNWSSPTPSICSADIVLDNFLAVDASGTPIPIGKIDKTVYHSCVVTNTEDLKETLTQVSIFPNPADDLLHFDLANASIDEFIIYDALGRHVAAGIATPGIQTFDITHLPEGIYIISFYRNGDVVSKRFSVVR
ncbi:MAG: T9SS type A sorting domain-containing protein [Bacteroidota bacterium]